MKEIPQRVVAVEEKDRGMWRVGKPEEEKEKMVTGMAEGCSAGKERRRGRERRR